ncbi:MAG TPA: glutathione S-transferase C-terminal domain-containing protein, partial [Reyranella sp.]|nr:glutathione S-transferase C-terminal domain-containing protein [Reyranella sp.]
GVLDQLEAETKSLKGKPTLGTITVGCALGYLDFRFGDHNWRTKRPKLAKWFTTFSKLPSMKTTAPPPT